MKTPNNPKPTKPTFILWFGPDPGPDPAKAGCLHKDREESTMMGEIITVCIDCNKGFMPKEDTNVSPE
jgi:hypothetical protein